MARRPIILITSCLLLHYSLAFSQEGKVSSYSKKSYMIPMRDGVKLYTLVITPTNQTESLPILIKRTPYGADRNVQSDSILKTERLPSHFRSMAKEGYIFVFQDIRGKYKSEGYMEIQEPLMKASDTSAIDESTDTWDTVDWLIKNLENNNGKAGIFGISYPGWLALVGAVNPHPALKTSSDQACMGDLFLGDDFHHNGAFRLSYGMEYTYQVEHDRNTDSEFPFPGFDLFNWYLQLGSLKNVNEKYFHDSIPTWNNIVMHPDYDAYWQEKSPLSYIDSAKIPQLHVGGYYDQEDINGPQLMYEHMEKNDGANLNYIVLGPWNHGQWAAGKATNLGKIGFESNTSAWFQDLQKKWFDFWLKGIGDGKFDEASCFQTGRNQWKNYTAWPPENADLTKLFIHSDFSASFTKPGIRNASVSYISDPAKPVPYRPQPVEATYGPGSRWGSWQVDDQRFAGSRPDVVSFKGVKLEEDLTVTGKIIAHIFASSTATDADFIVKLIDVYPDIDSKNLLMSGYEFPVAMEVIRGRYRKSFENPEPLIPGKPEEFVIDLHNINHTFLKDHFLMVQIQSTWFPVIDRNPQKYVPNIFMADESDFIKATQTIYCNTKFASFIEMPVIKE